MKTLDKGQEKIQKICDELRRDTIEPAKKQAETIISEAHERAQDIIKEAEKETQRMMAVARTNIEQEQNVFKSSLSQGIKQSLEALRQEIEHKLFNDQITSLVKAGSADPQIISKLIDAVIKAIDKEGISADLSAIIPKNIPEKEVNRLLGENILKQLREKSVTIGDFDGGAQIKLNDKRLTIDISDKSLKELLARYIRKDFRQLIFGENT